MMRWNRSCQETAISTQLRISGTPCKNEGYVYSPCRRRRRPLLSGRSGWYGTLPSKPARRTSACDPRPVEIRERPKVLPAGRTGARKKRRPYHERSLEACSFYMRVANPAEFFVKLVHHMEAYSRPRCAESGGEEWSPCREIDVSGTHRTSRNRRRNSCCSNPLRQDHYGRTH
jgi:hypothetical protein